MEPLKGDLRRNTLFFSSKCKFQGHQKIRFTGRKLASLMGKYSLHFPATINGEKAELLTNEYPFFVIYGTLNFDNPRVLPKNVGYFSHFSAGKRSTETLYRRTGIDESVSML